MPRRKTPVQRKSNNTIWIVVSAVGAIVFVAALVWLATSPTSAPATAPKIAAGKTWGNAGAPIVLEEYSDFQ